MARSAAGSAVTPPGLVDPEVHAGVLVPLRAVRLPRIDSSHTITAKDVLPKGHRLHVSRIHTGRDAAEVVDREPFRDRADQGLVDRAMQERRLAVDIGERVAAACLSSTWPDPAAVGLIDLGQVL